MHVVTTKFELMQKDQRPMTGPKNPSTTRSTTTTRFTTRFVAKTHSNSERHTLFLSLYLFFGDGMEGVGVR